MKGTRILRAPWPIDAPLPATCLIDDVLRYLQISRSTFDRRLADGTLRLVEIASLDSKRRFTGESVRAARTTRWEQARGKRRAG